MEKKRIAGVLHKKIPCIKCDNLIWVNMKVEKFLAICTDCRGYPTMATQYRGERFDVHSRQYNGNRVGNNE